PCSRRRGDFLRRAGKKPCREQQAIDTLRSANRAVNCYSMRAPETLITLAHLRISDSIMLRNSDDEPGMGSAPLAIIRRRISGSFSADCNSALRRLTTAAGVPAGATTPNQPMDS